MKKLEQDNNNMTRISRDKTANLSQAIAILDEQSSNQKKQQKDSPQVVAIFLTIILIIGRHEQSSHSTK